jgi:tetratricopeptide (TPR) repeat protein
LNIDVLYAAHQVHSMLADKAFMTMAQHDPDSARMYQLRGDRMAQIGNIEGAIGVYRLAIAHDPHLSGAHYSLGEALSISRNESERAEAEAEYKRALIDNPMDEKAECRLGDIETQRSNAQGAAQHYRRALELAPDDPDANEGYGIVLLNQDSVPDARHYLSRAIQLDPGNLVAHYHLSLANRKAGDVEAAKREMDEFLKLKTNRDNLKHSFDDLPLQVVRQDSQERSGNAPSKAIPEGATSIENKSK